MAGSNRDNTNLQLQAASASGDTTSMWFKNEGAKGAIFTFLMTTAGSTLALPTWTVQGRVGATTRAYNVASLATTSQNSLNVLVVYPAATTAGSEFPAGAGGSTGARGIVSLPLPFQFRVRSTNVSTEAVTWAGWIDLLS